MASSPGPLLAATSLGEAVVHVGYLQRIRPPGIANDVGHGVTKIVETCRRILADDGYREALQERRQTAGSGISAHVLELRLRERVAAGSSFDGPLAPGDSVTPRVTNQRKDI